MAIAAVGHDEHHGGDSFPSCLVMPDALLLRARRAALDVGATMYPYPFSGNQLHDVRGQRADADQVFADVVVFDDETIIDVATPEKPHQFSRGVEQVFVNGVQVIRDGQHTGATPGRVLKGPGATR